MSSPRTAILPLFPLPDAILLPRQAMLLHVFEQRYRDMTRDLLDGRGELVIGTVLGDDKEKLSQVAPCQPIAGIGRLENYQPVEDGRFIIELIGQCRAEIEPIDSSEKSYPLAEVTFRPDDPEFTDDTLRERAARHLKERGVEEEVADKFSLAQMGDLLMMTLALEPRQRYEIFSELDLAQRLERTLELV